MRRIAANGALVAAGGRAILLQIADPVVGVGVRRHSDFARRPQQRLAHTLMYVYAVLLGSEADRDTAAAFVHRAHRPVAGADDADRQLWVAATLYDSAVRMHEALTGPVSPELAEALLRFYRPVGTALRVPTDRWPESVAAFVAYWDEAVEALRVTPEARGVVRDLFHPRFAPAWVRAAMPSVRVLTVGLLPDVVRSAYGFPWGPREQRRFRRVLRALRIVVRVVPGPLLRLPGPLLLRRMRRTARTGRSSASSSRSSQVSRGRLDA